MIFIYLPAPKNGCVELVISHCPKLQCIHNSFLKVPNLCRLDLSYNNLKVIDHNWANWSALTDGVDFQGNPIECNCTASQWMLDFLVPLLHNRTEHQKYLYELRCATPKRFHGHRLVRYFKHDGAFCTNKVIEIDFLFCSVTNLTEN